MTTRKGNEMKTIEQTAMELLKPVADADLLEGIGIAADFYGAYWDRGSLHGEYGFVNPKTGDALVVVFAPEREGEPADFMVADEFVDAIHAQKNAPEPLIDDTDL